MRSNRINEALYGKKYEHLLTRNKKEIALCRPSSNTGFQGGDSINPYDFVGEIHNEALDYFFQTFGKSYDRAASTEGALEMINSFLNTKYGFRIQSSEATEKMTKILSMLSGSQTIPNLPMGGRITLGGNEYQVLNNIFLRCSQVTSDKEALDLIKDINLTIARFEKTPMALAESSLFFSSLSVAGKSLEYKLSSPNVNSLPWTPDDSVARAWPKWAGADIVGAYTSFQLSMAGIGGSLGGPVGFFGTMAVVGAAGSYVSTL